jgi:hypothetical protein
MGRARERERERERESLAGPRSFLFLLLYLFEEGARQGKTGKRPYEGRSTDSHCT